MKFKLDENLGTRTRQVFEVAGHDIETVVGEGLSGGPDTELNEVCRREERCLVTLDLDFADVLRFPPAQSSGIIVIRVPRNPTLPILEQLARQIISAMQQMAVQGNLWIVEVGRIRVHQQQE